jgi:glyceraldehyde 3-phosphate dehydrogenase
MIGSYSMRTPTHIVGAADLTLLLKEKTTQENVIKVFEDYANNQKWDIINNNWEPLVSLDFKRSEFSANVDHRFTSLVQGNMLKLVLWYDNEWGYAARVCDQIKYIANQLDGKL